MKNLYKLVMDVEKKKFNDEVLGLNILSSILSNRQENDDIYRRGETSNFRNKEMSRIVSGLEKLVKSSDVNVIYNLTSRALHEYRDIFQLNFAYDALKCSFQYTEDEVKSAMFMAKVLKESSKQFQGLSQYDKDKLTINEEFKNYLRFLKNAVKREYSIILDSNI